MARKQMIRAVLATPPEIVTVASLGEQARINAMLDTILTVSARAQGLRADTAISKSLLLYNLKSTRAPTLIVSARDDGYGTYASARYTASQIAGSKFVGFEHGGHTWVGHDEDVTAAIGDLLVPAERRSTR